MSFFDNILGVSMLTGIEIPIVKFIINMLLCAIVSYILIKVYIKYGKSLSNRKLFANNFLLIALTTMFIITIVKSSLALSLGLVGALSIIRFRAAIKEPEELAYLFFAIGIGLGFGADQTWITIVAFITIIILLYFYNMSNEENQDNYNLHLIISTIKPKENLLEIIVEILKKNCLMVRLERFDDLESTFEASFLVEFDHFENLNETKYELKKIDGNLGITFLDNKGII